MTKKSLVALAKSEDIQANVTRANPQVLEKFKVTQALLARQGLGVVTSWRCSHILTSRESWVSKS